MRPRLRRVLGAVEKLCVGDDDKGKKSVWHRSCAPGLEKRLCTIQLTVFADGKAYVKPLLIFQGKGLRIADVERKQYDSQVVVRFQKNAWCDEKVMKFWVRNMWKRPFGDDSSRSKLLIADVHRAQTTTPIQQMLSQVLHRSCTCSSRDHKSCSHLMFL